MPANALDYVTIQGFKSIARVEKLQLRPINLLIGPNGSGKSNFIGVFAFLHAIREGRLGEYVTIAGGADKDNHSGPVGRPQQPREQGREAGISDPQAPGIASYIRGHLGRWRVYHVHDTSSSSPMRKTSKVHDNRFLRPDGSNLASFLFLLKERHQDAYNLIRWNVQQVAPFFDNFELRPLSLKPDDISWSGGTETLINILTPPPFRTGRFVSSP